jgi:hypothetical protein
MTLSFSQRIVATTLTFASFFLVPSQAQINIDPPQPAWVLSTTTAKASMAFSLGVESYRYSCATTFANQTVSVSDGRIDLSFTTETKKDVACPLIYKPYGTAFTIPALKVGTYKVFVNLLAACHVAPAPCKLAIPVEEAGTLVVTAGQSVGRQGWFLKKPEVLSGEAFSLDLLNNQYGNCNTHFSHTTYAPQANQINVSFVIENNPDQVCIVDIRPHGPSFPAQGLKPGRYPVYVNVLPACMFTVPQCLMIPPLEMVPSDTLVVMQTLGLGEELGLSPIHLAAYGNPAGVTIRLPADAEGIWGFELLTLSGQRVQSLSLQAHADKTLSIPFNAKIQRGVYLVRLVSPSQETHLLRLPIQD